jgi:superfamily II DNA or RNA helicase
MILRPYQTDLIEKIRAQHKDGHRRVLAVMPTGAGKTVTFVEIARMVGARNRCVLIIVPRIELVRQTCDKLAAIGVDFGVVAAGRPRHDVLAPVQVATAQTLVRRKSALAKAPAYIIIDECHLAAAQTWTKILKRYPDARTLGVTATLERLDGKGFENLGTALVKGPTVAQMIEMGNLSPFKTFTLPVVDANKIRMRMGEYDQAEQAAEFERATLVGDVLEHWRKHAQGRSTIVFAASVDHSQLLADRFIDADVPAEHIDGETPAAERAAALARLASGQTTVICNYGVLTEGFDCPRVSCIVLARITASRTLFRQMAGRGLRPYQGKADCVILDHGGNALRHGNVDYDVPYTIEGRPKKEKPEIIQCPDCALIVAYGTRVCPECGAVLVEMSESRTRSNETVKGNLVELAAGYAPPPPKRQTWQSIQQAQRARDSWADSRRSRAG